MAKIMLEVKVPGNGNSYEVVADDRIEPKELIDQLCAQLAVADSALRMHPETLLLVDTVQNKILQQGIRIAQQGVYSGHQLILV